MPVADHLVHTGAKPYRCRQGRGKWAVAGWSAGSRCLSGREGKLVTTSGVSRLRSHRSIVPISPRGTRTTNGAENTRGALALHAGQSWLGNAAPIGPSTSNTS